MPGKRSYPRSQRLLVTLQLLGDLLVSYLGLCAGYWLRFNSPLRALGVEDIGSTFATYNQLLFLGAGFFVISYAFLSLYDARLLLRPHRSANIILRGTFFWFALFLSTSLILKFDPAISRIFVAVSCLTTLVAVLLWRFSFFYILSRSEWRERITQRVALVGWSGEAESLTQAILSDKNHPYSVYGVITTPATETQVSREQKRLGSADQLDQILDQHLVDIIVVADLDLSRDELGRIAAVCERRYVDFKVIPSFFQVFVSSLRMQTVSGVPLLGIEQIPLHSVPNQIIKRLMDIGGALIGLTLSTPLMLLFTFLIRRESPGPVFYKQVRTGLHGRPFTIIKLRSMRADAEAASGPQWATAADPRRLKIGAFMREWNLDELPQFWNILKGDMSLVGPRPERPELIRQFEHEIPHYNPRHEVRPGLTGWAQVNGLRGNTSLVERIRYDLYYIENWSFWFDVQIMILTFFRRRNAY
ncbi:sugar transferase [Opitutus sp. GAS368]|uniref:sugar transferase n=1 Tax=Opitutus sp. GAS368 TaxID=1882749 RepID=UPI00087ADC38|nr:sugar transferase [Opitutus sp. GAS368]SDS46895.1 Undecaprenyl-phosphate glucose phosphotransferase [Opitutus sp. GAS368]